ncbi:hypothetical protein J6V86_00290 [bacterium]|nr:hypothetical protein [bacterium]
MAKETRPINPFSTKKWKKFQAPQSLLDLLKEDGEYSIYKGKIDDESSFFLVGKFGNELYAYSISKENLCQLEKLQERLKKLKCKFKQNEGVNPFEGWRQGLLNRAIGNYEARVSYTDSGRSYCVGRFGDSCYTFNMNDRKSGVEIDWVKALGVYVRY